MKKMMMLSVMLMAAAAGTAGAEQMKYKNQYPIVEVRWNSTILKPRANDVPALVMDNRLMVPSYMLEQVGMTMSLRNGKAVLKMSREDYYRGQLVHLTNYKTNVLDKLSAIDRELFTLYFSDGTSTQKALDELRHKAAVIDGSADLAGLETEWYEVPGVGISPGELGAYEKAVEEFMNGIDAIERYWREGSKTDLESFQGHRKQAAATIASLYEKALKIEYGILIRLP